jgi:hypothetical protein
VHERIALGICFAMGCALPSIAASADDGLNRGSASLAPLALAQDTGPNATDAQGVALLQEVERKFGGVMRSMYGWDAGAFERLYGYKNLPLTVLEKAVAARSYEQMLATLTGYHAIAQSLAAAKASGRKSYDMAITLPGEEADPLIVAAKRDAAKVLGDSAKDLVFVPVAPCTVWDTRYATNPVAGGTITDGATRSFQVSKPSTPADFSSLGGNSSCNEATAAFAGGTPAAVMLTVYASNASSNGWLTFYKYSDPDPSQATISVYYAPGPTKTQNVIAKVNGGAYDVSATSRFGSVDASASVVGYFMRSPATPLECTTSVINPGTGITVAANGGGLDFGVASSCPAGYTATSVACAKAGSVPSGLMLTQGGGLPGSGFFSCSWRNASSTPLNGGDFSVITNCCRLPGR